MNHRDRVIRSLDGLSIGDAFGQRLSEAGDDVFRVRTVPPGPWPWNGATHMALSVVETLLESDAIDADALAGRFAARYVDQAHRGYSPHSSRLFSLLAGGSDWRDEAPLLNGGAGSADDVAAAYSAPIGAYFARHPSRAADETRAAAATTHVHTDGLAGAIAIATATALRFGADHPTGNQFIGEVLRFVPHGAVRSGIERASQIPAESFGAASENAAGAARQASATVPLCIWLVAHHGRDFADALWKTAAAGGRRDTLCAIVGGILGGAGVAVPSEWRQAREALPAELSIAAL